MPIFEISRSAYPGVENPGEVLGTIHFARFPESFEEKVTDATGYFKEDFEDGTLVTYRDAISMANSILRVCRWVDAPEDDWTRLNRASARLRRRPRPRVE